VCSGFSPYTADNTATGGGDGARGWRTRCALATCLNSRMHLRRRRNTPLPTRATAGGGVRAHSTTALGLSMASSASSAAVAVCSVVARPRFFAHMREPSARFLSGYSLSPYLHIFSSRKNMLAVSPTSPILATSSSLVFSFHDSPVSSFSQLRLGNHAKTCWPFHADFADSRRTLASRHLGQAPGCAPPTVRALVERQSAAAAPELAAPTDARRSSRREAHCGNVAARWFSIVFTTSDGRDRRSAAVLWFERLLLLCGV